VSGGKREAGTGQKEPATGRRVLAIALVAAVVGIAWYGAGILTRRMEAARIPKVPDLTGLSDAARTQMLQADAATRRDPLSANALDELGRAYQANLFVAPALLAYALAEERAPDDSRWPYHRALLLEERGEQEAAFALLTRVTELGPRHGLAWFRMGEIAFKNGNLDAAEDAYRHAGEPGKVDTAEARSPDVPARQMPPLSAYANFGLARVALERGDSAAARDFLQAVLREHPRFGSARSLLVQMDDRDGRSGAPASPQTTRAYSPPADPLLDSVVARSHNSDLLLKHAAIASRGGDWAWREYLVRRAWAANPNQLDVVLEMATLLQSQGKATEALGFLDQAERLAPGDHHVLVQQGRNLTELGRLDEAEAVLRRATRIRDAVAEYNLGTVLDRLGRGEEARVHYEQAVAIDPFHARALNNLAIGLSREGQGAGALALFARAIRAAPDNAETYTNLCSALIAQQRFTDALEAIDTSIALDPSDANAHNNRGIALANLGRLADARAAFDAALRIAPAHADARQNLERLRAIER
jgi:tetratricopeptide (TPR) repeat protein